MNTETRSEAGKAVEQGVEAVTEEVSRLRSELAGLVESAGQIGRERMNAIAQDERVTRGLAAGDAAIDGATRELRALERDIAEATRADPWRALGLAAGVGFLLGFLARR
ncbi:glycine zipper domain-containing protein [Amaricoccus sp. W119]|uniref:glycine zipper domain-containing protein n=1 Tax=Amaricoccus sp. W119 TaxID=3391833 RepID=UPI0039A4F37E